MKNSEYWKTRFAQLEAVQNRRGSDAFREIEQIYRQAQKEIEGKINTWYQRLAANNGVSMAEARKMLSRDELKEFKWDVTEYIKHGQENALTGGWMKELENASAKYHISRLEALKIQTRQSLEAMFGKQLSVTGGTMEEVYKSGYCHAAYELQKGFHTGWDIAGPDQSRVEKVLAKPWAADGRNFSERIWNNKQKLISEVHKELSQNVLLGRDPQKAIDAIAKKMNTSKSNAGRLVMTEEAFFGSAAQRDCFKDLDVEQFEVVATLDSVTSEICREMDGKHFPMEQWEVGVTAPPFHVNCRSTTVPYFEDDFGSVGKRAARGSDGKTYYVPADMTYKEWQKAFIDGDKSEFGESSPSVADADVNMQDVTENYLKNAKPNSGILSYGAGYRTGIHKKEIEIADWLHGVLGGDISLLQEASDCRRKTPDYVWNGKMWELKSISSAKAADSALRAAVKQIQENPGGVVLELVGNIEMAELEKTISNRFRRVGIDEIDIIIMAKSVLKKILKCKK